jgi:uncharacterized OB-fold protein
METFIVPGRGKLVSWTVIRRPPSRFRAQGPYTIAIVDLDAGVRLTGRLPRVTDSLRLGAVVDFTGMHDSIYLFEESAA